MSRGAFAHFGRSKGRLVARIRTIMPGFFDDPDIADLTFSARLFFIGLWTQADREGRLPDDMRRLKVRLFPFDDVDTEALADELHRKDLIRRYSDTDGHAYIWIRCFTKHQRPHHKETASVIAACPPNVGQYPGKVGAGPKKASIDPPESGVLILESGVRRTEHDARGASKPRASALDGFAEFWQIYPQRKRKSKGQAEKAWKALKPSADTQAAMLAALDVQIRSPGWRKDGGQFIPYPASWLRAKGWEDEDAQPRPEPKAITMDWFQECAALHGGDCGLDRHMHHTRKQIDAGKREIA